MTSRTRRIAADELYVSQRDFYQRAYEAAGDIPWEGAFDGAWLENRLKTLGPARPGAALEIGTGQGRGAGIMARRGYRTVGIDYVHEPLPHAVENSRRHKKIVFVQADLFEAPFRGGSFDVILDWGVFHHIRRSDTRIFIRAIVGLLRPGGAFLLGCFSTKFRHEGEKRRTRNWRRHHGHYDRFSTRAELKKIFDPLFAVNAIAEDAKGFYLIHMTVKTDPA